MDNKKMNELLITDEFFKIHSLDAVIDSGTMITFSSTCLMNVFKRFITANNLKLLVSKEVCDESVWRPISNKRFALNASRIKNVFNQNLIKVVEPTLKIKNKEHEILELANKCFKTDGGYVKILQRGEAEALALSKIYNSKALFIDERTTRSLIENPLRLKQVLEKRQKQKVFVDKKNVSKFRKMFSNLKIFRSADIVALAYEQDLFGDDLEHGLLELESVLYATKFAGCAISEKEIVEYIKGRAK